MMTTLMLAVHLAAVDPPKPAAYPNPDLLIEATDPKVTRLRVLDVRGKAKYDAGHIPGALLAEIGPWSKAVTAGKADAAFWKAELAKIGVHPSLGVVVYSDDVRDAARAWWMLKMAGVEHIRVMNGGWKAYTAAKLPVATELTTAVTPPFDWKPTERFADKAKVLEMMKTPGVTILDSRTKDEHTGEAKMAKKAGHIPGSVHVEWTEFLDPATGKFLAPDALKKLAADRKLDLKQPAVTYCQGGGRAAVAAFGLELMGVKSVRNYYASWGEWGNAEDTPVALPQKK